MAEEPFKDKYGKPLQIGFYGNTTLDTREKPTPTNVRFFTGEYVTKGGKRYAVFESFLSNSLKRELEHGTSLCSVDRLSIRERFFYIEDSSWIEDEQDAIDWIRSKSEDLGDKTLELPLEQEKPESLFMAPDVPVLSYSGQYGPNERHAPKLGFPGPKD